MRRYLKFWTNFHLDGTYWVRALQRGLCKSRKTLREELSHVMEEWPRNFPNKFGALKEPGHVQWCCCRQDCPCRKDASLGHCGEPVEWAIFQSPHPRLPQYNHWLSTKQSKLDDLEGGKSYSSCALKGSKSDSKTLRRPWKAYEHLEYTKCQKDLKQSRQKLDLHGTNPARVFAQTNSHGTVTCARAMGRFPKIILLFSTKRTGKVDSQETNGQDLAL